MSEAPTLGEMIANGVTPPTPIAPTPAPTNPQNAAEATMRLNELKNDATWRDRFLAGNTPEAREYRALRTQIESGDAPNVDAAMAGVLDDAPFQDSKRMQMVAATAHFRDLGIRDEVIRQTLTDYEVTPQEHAVVTKWKADRMRDPEWVEKYLAGHGDHKRDMMLANIVLTSKIKKSA